MAFVRFDLQYRVIKIHLELHYNFVDCTEARAVPDTIAIQIPEILPWKQMISAQQINI